MDLNLSTVERIELNIELPALRQELRELKKLYRKLCVSSISLEAHKQLASEAEATGFFKGYESCRGVSGRARMEDWT